MANLETATILAKMAVDSPNQLGWVVLASSDQEPVIRALQDFTQIEVDDSTAKVVSTGAEEVTVGSDEFRF